MRKIKQVVILIIFLIFCSCSFYMGIRFEKAEQIKQEECYVTQNLIAVVNADEGIVVDGQKINYGADFMNFPDVNFISTGLIDARDGVASGRYAAYILIPNNFSSSVNSINGKPEKANIQYELGNNLRTDVKEEVVQDVRVFVTNLNTNVSYVYVNSIMREFHSAQDGAKTVLDNDVIELEQINTIDTTELIYPFEYPEWERVEWELEETDLSEYYAKVDETVVKIESDYESYLSEGRLEFEELDQKRDVVNGAVIGLTDILDSVDIEYQYMEPIVDEYGNVVTISQNTVYDEGLKRLKDYEGHNTTTLQSQKENLKALVDDVEGTVDIMSLAEINNSLTERNAELQEAYKIVWDHDISVSFNSIDGERVINQNDANERYVVVDKAYLIELQQEIHEMNNITQDIEEIQKAILTIAEKINGDLPADVQRIITEEIVKPLEVNIEAEKERVQTAEVSAEDQVYSFMDELNEYDPLEYVDEDEINDNLLLIQESVYEMESDIDEQNLEYYDFVTEVYDTSDENYEAMLDEVEFVNEQTITNIETTVEETKEIRQEKNEINSNLLNDFSQKLAYTRVGKQENEAVNEFIVAPLEITDVSAAHTGSNDISNVKLSWKMVLIALSAILLFASISRIFYLYITKEGKEESLNETEL